MKGYNASKVLQCAAAVNVKGLMTRCPVPVHVEGCQHANYTCVTVTYKPK